MRLFLSTADASGDLHAAALVEALRKRVDRLDVFGLGGAALAAMGQRPIVAQEELAIAGLVEVVSSLPRALAAYGRLRGALRREAPDVVVLVDSPDLNLPLASVARRMRIPVVYYVAPQVWAWREGRVRKLRRRVDRVGVIFPFEEAYLRERGVNARFVGHPLVDRMGALRRSLRPDLIHRELGLDPARRILSLLPGSRRNEVTGNLECMVETAELLHRADPTLQILLLQAPTLDVRHLGVPSWIRVVAGRTHQAMALSTCLLSAPGTATVEAALLGVPHVVSHRGNRVSFELFRRIARVPSSCMVNLISGAGIVPELIQDLARPAALAARVRELLEDESARETMRRALERSVAELGPPGASERAADLVLEVARGV